MLLLEILLLSVPLLVAVIAFALMFVFLIGPPFVPTPMSVIRELIAVCHISEKDVVVDLGSGDGRMLVESARKGAFAKGWEINPFLIIWTHLYAARFGVNRKVKVFAKSYTTADLRDASVVFLYNLPKYMPELEGIMKHDLKKGSKIVTYKFTLPTIKPTKKIGEDIYLYIK